MTHKPHDSSPTDMLYYPPMSCLIGYSLLHHACVSASFTLLAVASGTMIGGLILAYPTHLVLNKIDKTGLSSFQKQVAGILTVMLSTCLSAVIGAAILGTCLGLALNPFILISVISTSLGIALLMGFAAAIFLEIPKTTAKIVLEKTDCIPLTAIEENEGINQFEI